MIGNRKSELIPEPLIYKLPDKTNFSVPPYFQYEHRETRKMINFMKGGYWQEVRKVIEKHPIYATNGYYQVPDNQLTKPLFHNFTILYLSIFGMALYYKQIKIARQLAKITRVGGQRFIPWNTMFYATNLHDRYYKFSDLYGFYAFTIIIRLEFFEAMPLLMDMGYQPHAEVSLPYRRPYSYYVYHYRDIVDYSLAQLYDRPNLFLSSMIKSLIDSGHKGFNMSSYEKIVVIYNDHEVTDWISIPRRFLRYVFYVDRNNMKVSSCLQAVKIFQENGFFDNCTVSDNVHDIHLANRLDYPSLDNPGEITIETQIKRIVFDYDCCIALLLAIYESLIQDNSLRIAEKASNLLIQILNDTRWMLLFLTLPPVLLSEYFNSLTENVTILARYIGHFIDNIPAALDAGQFRRNHTLLALRKTAGGKSSDWRSALNMFKEKHKTGLGGLASYTPLYEQQSTSNVTPNLKDSPTISHNSEHEDVFDKEKTNNSSAKDLGDSFVLNKNENPGEQSYNQDKTDAPNDYMLKDSMSLKKTSSGTRNNPDSSVPNNSISKDVIEDDTKKKSSSLSLAEKSNKSFASIPSVKKSDSQKYKSVPSTQLEQSSSKRETSKSRSSVENASERFSTRNSTSNS